MFMGFFKRKKKENNNVQLESMTEVTVDNFDLIKSLMKFDDKNDFYFLQVIQRKKDGCDVPAANNGYRCVRTFYIKNYNDFEQRKKSIIQLCKQNKARAYINLNVRNMKNILLNIIKEAAALIEEDRCDQGFRILEHICGTTPKKGVKKSWIVDVDTKDKRIVTVVKKAINMCRSANKIENDDTHFNNILSTIQTLNGYHIITIGFDKSKLKNFLTIEADATFGEARKDVFPDELIDEICGSIKKDNPTLLYFTQEK